LGHRHRTDESDVQNDLVESEWVEVFTDGACIGNPGPGGWAWAIGPSDYASGFEDHTTNQRMELSAALRAIESLDGLVEVVSDSTYVVNCFRDRWWDGWRRRGWKNSKGVAVANQDLWIPLVAAVVDERGGEIRFRWVKGHATDPMNNFVDSLANGAAREGAGRRAGRGTEPEHAGEPPSSPAI
jgi:ribonuclease HI